MVSGEASGSRLSEVSELGVKLKEEFIARRKDKLMNTKTKQD
jgi:hypothetical protein